ncbi:flagellar protein FlaG [Bacillus sp. T3]|uniref:flagellar protein FlaG n=1 Tax=Bacillus sp. T3 TaxID=467262 RepID=UPI0029828638|nr:flagellar protein FlaG [Bacillus sp. T3]
MSDRMSITNNIAPGLTSYFTTDYQAKTVEMVEAVQRTKETTPEKNGEQSQQQQHSREQTEKVINGLNEFLKASNSHLKFEFHEKLKEYYVTVVDDKTNEVIKEIPSKKLMDMYAAMADYIGLIVDQKI